MKKEKEYIFAVESHKNMSSNETEYSAFMGKIASLEHDSVMYEMIAYSDSQINIDNWNWVNSGNENAVAKQQTDLRHEHVNKTFRSRFTDFCRFEFLTQEDVVSKFFDIIL